MNCRVGCPEFVSQNTKSRTWIRSRRREMEATPSRCLFLLFLFTCKLSPDVAAEIQESSDGSRAPQEPVRLTGVPAAMEFIAAAEVAVIGFFQNLEIPAVSVFHGVVQKFQDVSFGISTDSEVLAHYNITENTISLFRLVDNEQLNLESEDIDDTRLSRFIEINSLHFVTEYNPATVIGLFNSMVQIHLLLMMDKAFPEYEESLHRYHKAAKLFQGKILFILVDSGVKGNGKVISFFKLKKSELPALAIYRTLDEEWDTLHVTEVSIERVQNFCDGFLKGKRLNLWKGDAFFRLLKEPDLPLEISEAIEKHTNAQRHKNGCSYITTPKLELAPNLSTVGEVNYDSHTMDHNAVTLPLPRYITSGILTSLGLSLPIYN